jgi:hypothetical protein
VAKNWVLQHDSVPEHQSLLIQQQLTKHDTVVLPHPPYSPSLILYNFLPLSMDERLAEELLL